MDSLLFPVRKSSPFIFSFRSPRPPLFSLVCVVLGGFFPQSFAPHLRFFFFFLQCPLGRFVPRVCCLFFVTALRYHASSFIPSDDGAFPFCSQCHCFPFLLYCALSCVCLCAFCPSFVFFFFWIMGITMSSLSLELPPPVFFGKEREFPLCTSFLLVFFLCFILPCFFFYH